MVFDSELDSDEEDITSAVDCGCEHALVKAKTIQLVFAASPLIMFHVEVRSAESNTSDVLAFDEGLNCLLCLGLGGIIGMLVHFFTSWIF
jgi:hypothetical protein